MLGNLFLIRQWNGGGFEYLCVGQVSQGRQDFQRQVDDDNVNEKSTNCTDTPYRALITFIA
jgi:hypothetical protein